MAVECVRDSLGMGKQQWGGAAGRCKETGSPPWMGLELPVLESSAAVAGWLFPKRGSWVERLESRKAYQIVENGT